MILNETQQAIRDAVRAFAQERIKPRSAAFEAARGYPRELFEQLAGLGVMGMTAPEEVGGAGADYVSYALTLMEIAPADGAFSPIISIHNSLIVTRLLNDATPAHHQRFLPTTIAVRMPGPFVF